MKAEQHADAAPRACMHDEVIVKIEEKRGFIMAGAWATGEIYFPGWLNHGWIMVWRITANKPSITIRGDPHCSITKLHTLFYAKTVKCCFII
jgi:hypothetical protein